MNRIFTKLITYTDNRIFINFWKFNIHFPSNRTSNFLVHFWNETAIPIGIYTAIGYSGYFISHTLAYKKIKYERKNNIVYRTKNRDIIDTALISGCTFAITFMLGTMYPITAPFFYYTKYNQFGNIYNSFDKPYDK